MAKAKFEAQIRAHREKTARLRAERLARLEASWIERRKDTIANIKSGIVELQIKTALMKARRFIKVDVPDVDVERTAGVPLDVGPDRHAIVARGRLAIGKKKPRGEAGLESLVKRARRSQPADRGGFGISSSLAHAFHCFQLASNSALASSSVAARLSVRRVPGLLGACSAQNQRRSGAGAGFIDATDAPLAAEHAVIDVVLIDAMA